MKEENVFKKIFVKSLLGIFIGITVLMISYLGLYLIEGEMVYKTEIAQLQNINTLVLQLIMIGCAYYLFLVIIGIISYLNSNKTVSDKFAVEHPIKTILIAPLLMVIIGLILLLLKSKVFTENISIMNAVLFLIILMVSVLYLCIKSIIESNVVKEINIKLKERNN